MDDLGRDVGNAWNTVTGAVGQAAQALGPAEQLVVDLTTRGLPIPPPWLVAELLDLVVEVAADPGAALIEVIEQLWRHHPDVGRVIAGLEYLVDMVRRHGVEGAVREALRDLLAPLAAHVAPTRSERYPHIEPLPALRQRLRDELEHYARVTVGHHASGIHGGPVPLTGATGTRHVQAHDAYQGQVAAQLAWLDQTLAADAALHHQLTETIPTMGAGAAVALVVGSLLLVAGVGVFVVGGGPVDVITDVIGGILAAIGAIVDAYGLAIIVGLLIAAVAAWALAHQHATTTTTTGAGGVTHHAVTQQEVEQVAAEWGLSQELARRMLEAGLGSAEALGYAARLQAGYPKLASADIVTLVRLILAGVAIYQVESYLGQLCGGLNGIGPLLAEALQRGDAAARTVLDKLVAIAKKARAGDEGSQRVLNVVDEFGADKVAATGEEITGAAGKSDADVVLRDGTAIESTTVGKSDQDLATQLNKYIGKYGIDHVKLYIEGPDDATVAAKIKRVLALMNQRYRKWNAYRRTSQADRKCAP